MKKLLFFFFAFILHISIHAQTINVRNVDDAAQQLTQNLKTMVELTPEQEEAIIQINKDKLTAANTFRENGDSQNSRQQFIDRRQAVRDALTADQRAILDQINGKHKDF